MKNNIHWLFFGGCIIIGSVIYLAASEAVAVAAPIAVWAALAFSLVSAVIFVAATGTDKILWFLLRLAEFKRDKSLAENEAKRAKTAADVAYIDMVARAKFLAATLRQVESGLIHPAALNDGKFSSFPRQVINKIEDQAIPMLEAPAQELLPAIRECENILVVGGKGSGKTTLLQWLESERLQSGQTITLDSHAVPGQWTGQYIGNGREYDQIKTAMIALVDKMDARHKKRTVGQTRFEPINTLIDEFTLLPGYLKQRDYDVQSYSFPMLTEGRKVEMNCLWGTHSDRAEPLGMKGMADLKECFDVLVYLKKVKGRYYAVCDFGEGKEETKYVLPGPFYHPVKTETAILDESETANAIDDYEFVVAEREPEPNKPTPEEMAIIEAVATVKMDHGKIIWSKVTKQLGQVTSGANNDRIKKCLDKWNIAY